jgi:ATP-dependent Clp protease ATP-binding subunit ClpC
MYERFTDRARRVMKLAQWEAEHFNHEHIGTQHILIGLLIERDGVAANILQEKSIGLQMIRLEVEKIVHHGPGEKIFRDRLGLTPRAMKVIDFAHEEAHALNHKYVGTEHLLLALMKDKDGVAHQVILNLGLKPEGIREDVFKLLGLTPVYRIPKRTFLQRLSDLCPWFRGRH